MRGKRRFNCFNVIIWGLIPAHAGKTTEASPEAANRPAHPRACGENVLMNEATAHMRGSSPRMRGKQARACGP